MKALNLCGATLLIALSISACHSSRKLTDNSEPFHTLRTELYPTAAVLRIADTIKIIYPETAMFDFGKDMIKAETKPKLVRFAAILKQYPDIHVLISGYTDNIGAEDANIDLSRRRAVNTYNFLNDNGVDAVRMNTVGYGPQYPMRNNATDEGRAANRRVEFKLYKAKK